MKPTDPTALLNPFLKALDAVPPETVTVDFAHKFLKAQGARMGLEWWEVLKSEESYDRMMRKHVKDFYEQTIDIFAFVSLLVLLIEVEYWREFSAGLRAAGYDPGNMTPEISAEYSLQLSKAFAYVWDYARELEQARNKNLPVEPFLGRVVLWATRLGEVYSLAVLLGSQRGDLLIWKLGATEKHCSTCATLNNVVAPRDEWLASGLRPRNAPNPRLRCGGWRCDCRMEPISGVDPTEGGIPNV